jgi:hypothetical protein
MMLRRLPSREDRITTALRAFIAISFAVLLCGCAARQPRGTTDRLRPFQFSHDTFAYPNQLVWEYRIDPASGKIATARRQPPSNYTHRCFAMARSARQFFVAADFDPTLPKIDDAGYRRLIRKVVATNPRAPSSGRITIPGYATLHNFSSIKEPILKEECGSRWKSYFQRGHWRMVFPFSRPHQDSQCQRLVESLQNGRPPIVHLVRFPQLTINHALLLFDFSKTPDGVEFQAYDPNQTQSAVTLSFDEQSRTFKLPASNYFAGGRVDVYEIFSSSLY